MVHLLLWDLACAQFLRKILFDFGVEAYFLIDLGYCGKENVMVWDSHAEFYRVRLLVFYYFVIFGRNAWAEIENSLLDIGRSSETLARK